MIILNKKKNKNDLMVTIIIPMYNGEKYLPECVESILNQQYDNFELILVDDGSPDNCGKMADEYSLKDSRVKVIHQKNAGVSSARNNALNIANGDYICFVDQDDYIEKDYLSYFLNLIYETGAEISLTPTARRFTANTKNIKEKNNSDYVSIWSGKEAAINMLYYNVIIGPWNKIIKRSIIVDNSLKFNDDFFGGEGFAFSVECFQRANKVAVGHRKIYCYRVDNPNSGTTKFSLKMIESSISSQKYIKDNLVEKTCDLMKACQYANWHTYCDCLNTIIGCKVKKQYIKEYKKIKKTCQHDALCTLNAPIPLKEKFKGLMYFINPYFASKIINKFRLRKFTIEDGK